jgi:hypothetical protein
MLDSLVRVSRRVGWDPTSTLRSGPPQVEHRNLFLKKKISYDTSREETGHDRAVLLGNAALVTAAPVKATTKLANGNAPCNRHPVGRGVLLGPPLADLGAAIAIQSIKANRATNSGSLHAALRACNQVPGAGTCSTFEGPPV